MEKKKLAIILILGLLFMAVTEVSLVGLAHANPYKGNDVAASPPADATPIAISVLSPRNNTVYSVNHIALNFNVSTEGTSMNFIYDIYFKASWMQDNVTVFKQNGSSPEFPIFRSYEENFSNLPDGKYSLTITARGHGYYVENTTVYHFQMTTVSVVNFTIATPPEVCILSPDNKTYNSSDVQLNFDMSDKVSLLKYSLDKQENVTIIGNTTLTGLSNGSHNITVYANDSFGNIGTSKTVSFTIAEEPLTALPVAAVSTLTVVVAFIGLIVYFKKRKRKKVSQETFTKGKKS